MIIWPGINFPLAEFLLVLAIIFTGAIIYFAHHLRKLEKLTSEEKTELVELEKMAQEEKSEIDKIAGVETIEQKDLKKFESEIEELEVDTETIYLKKLVPDVYRLQNYVLWALKKEIPVKEIKENLAQKGWKDKKLIDMIVEDMAKYVGYYKSSKGNVKLPVVRIEEKTQIIKPTKIINVEGTKKSSKTTKPKKKKKSKKKSSLKKSSLKKSSLGSVEKEIKQLESDLKKSEKKIKNKSKKKKAANKSKPSVKKSTKKKPAKEPAKKKKAEKAVNKKPNKKGTEGTVKIEAKKGTEVKVSYK
ncbi:hypothetical protein JXB41_02170 [Candidatus Woesearchaeota archaeon]|nr:hypothetical protein [Candidatus Woesearchaeota archaeon]